MGITTDKLVYVVGNGSDNSLVGAYLTDAAGNLLTSQLNGSQQALDVHGQELGPVTPGTAANFSSLAGGQYNSTPPTLTTGQQAALQLDAAGRLLVDADINFTSDTNYGTVGANTLRTAAQIGNATGAADFNAGATGAQTLRVVANQGAPGTAANGWFTKITDGTNTATVSAGGDLNVTVATALPAGSNNIGSVNQGTSPWVVSGTVAATQSGTWTVGLSEDHNYGTVGANTLRTAAQIGNATGAADFGAGAATAQTLRTASELYVGGTALTLTGTSLNVDVTGGTIAVTQSTSPWIVKDQADGSATGGTAGSFSNLAGGIYNSTPPTLTNGQQASLQLDSSGNLLVDVTSLPAMAAPNTAFDTSAVTVGLTAIKLPTSNLASRKGLLIQNLGNKPIYIGTSTVTTSTGVQIAGGGTYEASPGMGPALQVWAISGTAGQDVRIMEIA